MPEARSIRLLPDALINVIAAGEVVERPASVIKELIENALDAGASDIAVEVTDGGRKLVRVADDGCGMRRDDALLSVERHATSKLREARDLDDLHTMGFRGEALAAIAAVSQFTLRTRVKGEASGTEVLVQGGRMQDVRDAGCPEGTEIAVRNLFYNVPARRRFLRGAPTEMTHIRQVFSWFALACPGIAFRLTADGRELHRLPAASCFAERAGEWLGAERMRAMRPIDDSGEGLSVKGLAGLPQFTRTDRAEQFLYVNRRPVSAPLLLAALNEAYRGLTARGTYPAIVLFVELDPRQVDVNVHPTKREVRFRKPSEVREAVIRAVRGALASSENAPPSFDVGTPQAPAAVLTIDDLPVTRPLNYPRMQPPRESDAPAVLPLRDPEPRPPRAPWAWCRVLGQVAGLYVVIETEDGMVLLDPHAAHERVLYERMLKQRAAGEVPSQGLLHPQHVDLSAHDAERVRANLKNLCAMGFSVEPFGPDAFVIDAVPAGLETCDLSGMLSDLVQEAERPGLSKRKGGWGPDLIAQTACRLAVRARDRLSLGEIESLLADLARAEMPYTCPHGRPTMIYMSHAELRRKFGRA